MNRKSKSRRSAGEEKKRRNTMTTRGADLAAGSARSSAAIFFRCEHVLISGVAMAAAATRPRGDLAFDEPHAAASISLSPSLSLSVHFFSLVTCSSPVTAAGKHKHTPSTSWLRRCSTPARPPTKKQKDAAKVVFLSLMLPASWRQPLLGPEAGRAGCAFVLVQLRGDGVGHL